MWSRASAAVREQAFWYIPKPFRTEELLRLARRVLSSTSTASPIEVVSATPNWVELLVPCEHEAAFRVYDFLIQLETALKEQALREAAQAQAEAEETFAEHEPAPAATVASGLRVVDGVRQ